MHDARGPDLQAPAGSAPRDGSAHAHPTRARVAKGAGTIALACLTAALVLALQRPLDSATQGAGVAAALAATAIYGLWLAPIALWLLGAAEIGAVRAQLPGDGRARYRRTIVLAMSTLAVVLFAYSAFLSISTRSGAGLPLMRAFAAVLGSVFLALLAAVAVWPAIPLLEAPQRRAPVALLAAGAAVGALAALPFEGAGGALLGALALDAAGVLVARRALARE